MKGYSYGKISQNNGRNRGINMIGSWLRRTAYFLLDTLKGSKVTKHYRDIVSKMSGKKECFNELSELLRYSKENVPYYTKVKGSDLNDFPVVNKKDIMSKFEEFQSTIYSHTDLHWVSTSGSTGIPFKANQNSDKRNRTIADLIYFHRLNGWNLGDKYVFLRAWTSLYTVSKFKLWIQNFIIADVVNFDEKSKEIMRNTLKRDKNVRVVIGYASAMESFVNYLQEKGDNPKMFNLKVIFTDSDNLSDLTKEKLEKMFGCPVINRYSNEEQGVLACTSAYEKYFRLNTASYYFELLKLNSDEPVGPGEIGRLVVTDLYNRSMPFIRYDTGDLAISDDRDRKKIMTLSSLQGRVADVITDTKGNMISAAMVNNYLHEFYKIKQYQLIQNQKHSYILKVVCDSNTYSYKELVGVCKEIIGQNANINIEYLDSIPIESTGKYKTVINRMR